MDKIQKTLIKLGHRDLAQEYYEKTAGFEKEAKGAFRGFPQNLIREFLNARVGEDSEWNNAPKLSMPKKNDVPQVYFKGSKPVIMLTKGNPGAEIYDISKKNHLYVPGGIYDNPKTLKAIKQTIEAAGHNLSSLTLKVPTRISIKDWRTKRRDEEQRKKVEEGPLPVSTKTLYSWISKLLANYQKGISAAIKGDVDSLFKKMIQEISTGKRRDKIRDALRGDLERLANKSRAIERLADNLTDVFGASWSGDKVPEFVSKSDAKTIKENIQNAITGSSKW